MHKLANKIKTNKIKFIFLAVIALISCITLGTAILSKTLNINGTTKIAKNSWIIYFDNVRKSSDSVPSDNDARIVDFGKTRIEFSANLKSIGDFYEFTVYTVNDGTIDAMVDSVEKSALTEEQQKYLDFNVTYDNGTPIRRCDTLNAKTRRRIKAVVKYKEGLEIDEYPTEDVNLNLYFNINYVQKDAACPPRELDDQNTLTIIPNGGVYQGRTDEIRIYMDKNETYTLDEPTRKLYNFDGWDINPEEGTYTISGNTFTMGDESVTLTAKWVEGDYVARIMNTYYPTIQEALDAAAGEWQDNTVYLLKDTTESPTNNTSKRVKFNLGGYTVTGTFTNSEVGDLQIVNGRFENNNENQITFKNYGNLIMGEDDGDVQVESSIAILGETTALQNYDGSTYYIYDGYLQAKHALVGGYTGKAAGYYVFCEYKKALHKDRVYLVKNNNRAICKTITNGEMFYYNLQSAIDEVEGNKADNPDYTDADYIIYAIRNFEAAYEIDVDNGSRVFFDTCGYNINFGENITNNGFFKVYNGVDSISTLRIAKTITNNSSLEIENLTINADADSNIINNKGALNVKDTVMHSKYGYDISNTGTGTVSLDTDTVLSSDDSYSLYNSSPNLVINAGVIQGLYNTGTAVINGGTFNTKLDKTQNTYYTRYTNGINNEGTITMNGGIVHNNSVDTNPIINRGTFNFYNGDLSSNRILVQNSSGTFNVLDNEIISENTIITNGTININGGDIESTNNTAITGGSTVVVTNGTVKSDLGRAIDISGTVTVNGGTVDGKTLAISTGTFNISSGSVISDGSGVSATTSIVSGGTVTSENNALSTNTLNMTGGTITSNNGTGAVINTSGVITGGTIKGDMYGVDTKGSITLGANDGTVSITSPVLMGNSYGLYLEGTENNFYDGILKGQIDGYTGNTFTGLPLGYTVTDGEETIDGVHYETDYLSSRENWLRVGETEYNTINDASEAITESGTIYVIKDANVNFEQEFTNTDTLKNIVFDLNGHTVTTTQNITNKTNISVTMTDSDPDKQGNLTFLRKTGFINNGEVIFEKGTYSSNVEYIVTNNSGMRITGGKFNTSNNVVLNNSNLSIEGGIMNARMGVYNNGTTNMGGGEITVTDYGIRYGTVTMSNGNIYSAYRGISDATIHIIDGEVHARDSYALYSNSGRITVDEGNIQSDNSTAIRGARQITINDGQIVGKVGIENEYWYDGVYTHYENVIINDGTIHGNEGEGIIINGGSHGNRLEVNNGHISGTTYGIRDEANTYIYDGVVEGGSYGVLNNRFLQVGRDEGTISTTNPIISGGEYGVYSTDAENDTRFNFYDGVLKGQTAGHYGLITKIPDATMVVGDYEYVDKVLYQLEYLGEQGDWLRAGDKTFNSINKAAEYVQDGGTIYVLNDVSINFEQTFPSEKGILFDLAGHSITMTSPLTVAGNVTIMDSVGHGSINNLKEEGIRVTGDLTIDQAVVMSENKDAITNSGTLTVNDGLIRSNKSDTYGINNSGTLVFNGGKVEASIAINNTGTAEINGGEVEGKNGYAIRQYYGTLDIYEHANISSSTASAIHHANGTTTVHGGNIVSTNGDGIIFDSYHYGTVNVEGGYIEGSNNGITMGNGSDTLNISGGIIKGVGNIGVRASALANITGGSIKGANYGVYASGLLTLGVDDGVVSIDEPTLKGGLYGLYIDGATVNFNDGILKGITDPYRGQITNIPNRTEIFEDSEVIDSYTYKTAYLLSESEIAINTTTQKIYTNLQDALDEAENNEIVQLIANVPLFYQVSNNNNNNITLDMHGFRITTNKKFINNKNLTITNSSDNPSFIRTSSDMNLLTNTGTLTLNNVEVINNSSSNYVIYNTNNLNMTNSTVTGLNGINNVGSTSLTNTNVNASYTGINNTNTLNATGGTIKGGNYSVYSYNNKQNSATNTIFNGTYYNQGGNTTTFTNVTANSSVQNNGSTLISNGSTFNNSILNTGTAKLLENSTLNGIVSSNSGTFEINNSTVNSSSEKTLSNSGTMTINNSTVTVNRDYSNTTIIYNNGTLNINNNSVIQSGTTNLGANYTGIYNYGNANVTIDTADILINTNNTGYGLYSDSASSSTTIISGNIEVRGVTTFGAYLNKGTLTMGEIEEGPESGTEYADVSTTDPKIYSEGRSIGIGIKNINGSFDFYDGIIWGSRYAKPETTTNVELNYEVTTYVDMNNGYEKAILEYMQNDYQGDQIAILNDVYYTSLQAAIDKCNEGDEILLLKSTTEDITIPNNAHIKINLRGHSVTTKVINNGELNVYNGSLQNFDENTVINNGTFIMGQNDGTVSSTSVRIVSETTAVINNGTFKMYDGYLQGVPSIQGDINEIANLSRIYTELDDQTERKYLQSLSREAIINKETYLIITIDPDSGVYKGSKAIQYEYLYYGDTYELDSVSKNGCEFIGWDVSDPNAISGSGTEQDPYVITVGLADLNVKALWAVSDDAVAHIGNEYYTSVMDAINDAKDNDTIEIIKPVTEDVTNNKNITINLHGNKITGEFINNGILRLTDGTIENTNGIGLVNNKTLTLGYNDGDIKMEDVKIIGTSLGLEQNGQFNFYDGYIEGEVAFLGRTDSVPQGYFLYNERVGEKQRVYLIGNPANAVAVIEDGGTQYFFSLQDAINTATISGSEIFIVRDFEATYPISVEEGADILINMNSYNITTGNDITNNGTLKIYDTSEDKGSITSIRTITNYGDLNIEDINITNSNSSNSAIENKTDASLDIKNSTITAQNGYAINNYGSLKLEEAFRLESTNLGLYNNAGSTCDDIETGYIKGLYTAEDLTLGENLEVVGNGENGHVAVGAGNNATLTINGTSIINTGSDQGVYNNGPATIIINEGTTINVASGSGLYCNAGTAQYTMNGGKITSSGIGVRMQADNCHYTQNGGDVTASSYGYYNHGIYNIATINDGTIKSTGSIAMRDERYYNCTSTYHMKIYINGGYVEGATHAIEVDDGDVYVENAEVKTMSANQDHYVIYGDRCNHFELNDGAFINAPKASGIRTDSSLTMNTGSKIYSGHDRGYGIYGYYLYADLNGGDIITDGAGSYGIMSAGNYYFNTTINGTNIKSNNIGIYLDNTTTSYSEILNVNSGSIVGKNYGIYQPGRYTTTIGKNDDTLSITDPFISGGLYGYYKTNGTANFYNGRFKGYTYGFNDTFNEVRPKKDIAEVTEDDEETSIDHDLSTNEVSTEALEKTAKKGNGYAKITYIGEDTDSCTNGTETTYDYSGSEDTFVATCSGKYKLEVWGAQGGSYNTSYYGGYGGYSKGEIELLANETLYINVGGQGTMVQTGNNPGGYNGGGATYESRTDTYEGSGGGATHIATHTGLLSELENSKNSILIVAGGGGGSSYYVSGGWSGSGGHGGGLTGLNGSYSTNNNTCSAGKGASQEAAGTAWNNQTNYGIGSFGQGGSTYSDSENTVASPGGGGGYYGGGIGCHSGAGGGSAYIGNSRLSNTATYTYDTSRKNNWIINYLVDKDMFLQVGTELFNSFEDASQYIYDELNGEGTIKLIKDASIYSEDTVIEGTTITFDLDGHTLTNSKRIINNGTLTVVDNGTDKGMIDCKKDAVFENKNNLTINGVYLKATGNNAILGSTGTGYLRINNNSKLEGTRGFYLTSDQTVTIEDSTITATADGFRSDAAANITINGNTVITSSDVGIRLQTDNNTLTINNADVTGTNYGIYTNGQSTVININDGTIKANTYDGIRDDRNKSTSSWPTYASKINVNGGLVQGARYGIYDVYSFVTVTDAEVKTTSTSNNNYAIYGHAWTETRINSGGFVNAPNASAIYTDSNVILDGGRIYSGNTSGYGIYGDYAHIIINSGSLETPGNSAYGIYCADYQYKNINMTGGTITSGYIGVSLTAGTNATKNFEMTGGTISGEKYGLYQTVAFTTTIGTSEGVVTNTTPVITGGEYGYYKTSGTANFYSGKLRGKFFGYYGDITNIRPNMSIVTESENDTDYFDNTVSTLDSSEEAKANTPKEGNGYARITLVNTTSGSSSSSSNVETVSEINCSNIVGTTKAFNVTKKAEEYQTYCEGTYKLEVWGAEGGYRSSAAYGGNGGYSSGDIFLENTDKLIVYVGSSGNANGFNGGGASALSRKGGGATDIRVNDDSLYSRVIVAGGGGADGPGDIAGGAAGGATGSTGSRRCGSPGTGGTQTSGGSQGGEFGIGGASQDRNGGHSGPGGGGWYGGGGGTVDGSADDDSAGGGGSGFVFTSDSVTPTGYLLDSKYNLTNTSIPSKDGNGVSVGNEGSGYAKITYTSNSNNLVSGKSTLTIKLVTDKGFLNNSHPTYNNGDTLGNLEEPDLGDSDYVFDGWYLDKEFTKKVNSNTVVYADATLYAKFKMDDNKCDNYVDTKFNFDYKGSEENFEAPCSGTYKLEVWGAQGGKALGDGKTSGNPGKGGYSAGTIDLAKGEKLYINVGGAGETGSLTKCASGGYNGGGRGTNDGGGCGSPNDDEASGGGGGATHIAKVSGLLKNLESQKDKVLIVAGGGGGASYNTYAGSGGGSVGGFTDNTTSLYPTDTEGYAFGQGQDATGTKQTSNCTAGVSSSCDGVGGGGGGYYGGYTQDIQRESAGTGGSGYINEDYVTPIVMYQHVINSEMTYYINYLDVSEGYLEVDGVAYNNFDDAINAINGTGTIKLLKDYSTTETYTFPSGKTVTFNLDGNTLTMNTSIINNGDLTITDGRIINTSSFGVTNNSNLTVTNVDIESSNHSIYGLSGTGTITITNSNLDGYDGIYLASSQTVVFNSGTINATDIGVRLQNDNSSFTMYDGSINATSHGIYTYGLKNNVVINDGTITSNGAIGLYDERSKNENSRSTIQINGGTIAGKTEGLKVSSNVLNVVSGEIISNSSTRSNYALVCYNSSVCTLSPGAKVTADRASAIYNYGSMSINGSAITSGASNSYGIDSVGGTLNITGNAHIDVTGGSAAAITTVNYAATININGATISSKNIGINVGGTGATNLNINDLDLFASNYGIVLNNSNSKLILGDKNENVSISNPSIVGGIYGIDNQSGSISFYSGIIKGDTKAYNGVISNIRDDYEIYEGHEQVEAYLQGLITKSTSDTSSEATSLYAKEGNGFARITLKDVNSSSSSESEYVDDDSGLSCRQYENTTYEYETRDYPYEFSTVCSGQYKVELWGAQGGYRSNPNMGGKGGYTSGYVNLRGTDNLLVYVGSSGMNGGYNGGGSTGLARGGGGATDIRLTEDLYTRIMVAGGGGSDGRSDYKGGAGGGLNSENAQNACGDGGYGSSQTSAGGVRAGFGYGGTGVERNGGYGGGGGGGWFGGGGTTPDGSADDDKGGGGGSSFVYDYRIFDTTFKGYNVDQRFMIFNSQLLTGNELIPSKTGSGTTTGNTGDGYARITFVKSDGETDYFVTLNTDVGTIQNNTLTYHYNDPIGNIPAPVVSDPTLTFDGWYLDKEFTKKVRNTYKVKSNFNLYAKFNSETSACESAIGTEYEFDYTGSEQTFQVSCSGTYTLETWGAQGGSSSYNANSNIGGYGGYTKADINLATGERLYISVGGKGQSIIYTPSEGTVSVDDGTGYNGGGYANYYNNNSSHGGGGGATHIATKPGLLNSLNNFKDKVIIVAGGGGGASTHASYMSYSGDGGSAGGYNGLDGITSNTTCYNYGTGGTQTGGGSYKSCSSDGKTYQNNALSAATFGKGQNYQSYSVNAEAFGGGGGGYYGGGAGWHGPGGGGSSYNNSSRTFNKYMYGYNAITRFENDATTAYLVQEQDFVTNFETGDSYSNLQTAIDEASDGDTLLINEDKSISYDVATSSSKKVIIDLNGHNLTTTKTMTNNKELKIIDSTINSGETKFKRKFDVKYDEDTFVVPADGEYTIEAWGAQGGSSGEDIGGYGAYTKYTATFNKDDVLYINVGGRGTCTGSGLLHGGYNGGGDAYSSRGSGFNTCAGGGATSVTTETGLLNTFENKTSSILLVAAGGGGATNRTTAGYSHFNGGSGGIDKGSSTQGTSSWNIVVSTGGTLTAGGQGGCLNGDPGATSGTFGQGGLRTNADTLAGGGGGYYGGGSGNDTGGGGGSSYVKDGLGYSVCYDCEYQDQSKVIGDSSEMPMSDTPKSGDGYVIITSDVEIDDPDSEYAVLPTHKISNPINETLIINNGTLDVEDVILEGYNIINSTGDNPINIKNVNVKATNNSIVSAGDLTINSSVMSGRDVINTSKSLTMNNSIITATNQGIKNTGTIDLTNTRINSNNQGINNTDEMTITDSTVAGSSYGIYDNSTKSNTISNSTIRSSSTAVHKQGTGLMTLTGNTIVGNISNSHASSTMNVTQGSITGTITNAGISTYTKVPMTYSSSYYYSENLFNNSGTLYLDECSLTFNSSYGSGSGYETRTMYNSGTLNSNKTTYTVNHTNGKYKWMEGIYNVGLLISNEDSIEITGAGASYGVFNNSSNDSTVTDMTIYQHDNGSEIYAYRSYAGKLTINGGTVTVTDNTWSRMLLASGSSNTILTDVTFTSSNNTGTSDIMYIDGNASTIVNVVRGTFSVSSTGETAGIRMTNGTLLINNGTFTSTSSGTAYGLKMADGTATVEKGTFTVNGDNVYGVHITSGTYTQGILDDRGTDQADISITDPHIEAVGTTSGIGIHMGNGTVNFYEGIIIGSTKYKEDGDIVTRTPNSYQVKVGLDENNYTYGVLEFIK